MVRLFSITPEYFSQYRRGLGFSNQAVVKSFFGAKDITPAVDLDYIAKLNDRLYEIVQKLNSIVVDDIKFDNLEQFKEKYIDEPFEIIKSNNILPRLNNQGRRPEQVYYSWMRGFVISSYFLKAISRIFEVDITAVSLIGDDDLRSIEAFKRTPKADLAIDLPGVDKRVRIELQSGFTGINDIKQHKVLEAKRVFRDTQVHTLAIHFDLYNGQVAFVRLDAVDDESMNWITRQQMEGQTVFNIDQNSFVWKLTEPPIKYKEINFDNLPNE